MKGLQPTLEMGLFGVAVLAAALTLAPRLGGAPHRAAAPPLPPLEAAAELAAHEVPIVRPLLVREPREPAERNPFLAASVWEDARPGALPELPERVEPRLLPIRSIGGGRSQAPRAPAWPDPLPSQDRPAEAMR